MAKIQIVELLNEEGRPRKRKGHERVLFLRKGNQKTVLRQDLKFTDCLLGTDRTGNYRKPPVEFSDWSPTMIDKQPHRAPVLVAEVSTRQCRAVAREEWGQGA